MLFYRIVRWIVAGGCRRRVPGPRSTAGSSCRRRAGTCSRPSHRSMMDIPFVGGRHAARRCASWARRRCSGSRCSARSSVRSAGSRSQRDGTDRKAVRDSIEMLQAGERAVVYPEGTRQHGPKIQPLQPGAAYLALRAGVPIVPVGIAGTEEILRSKPASDPAVRPGRDRGRRADRARRAGRAGVVPRDRGRRARPRSWPTRCNRCSTRPTSSRGRQARRVS